jgi:hypothetical protein
VVHDTWYPIHNTQSEAHNPRYTIRDLRLPLLALRVGGVLFACLGALLALWFMFGRGDAIAAMPGPLPALISPLANSGQNPLAGQNFLDVVINEVAWMGTAASPNDEWIELRNNTSISISLNTWRLFDGGDIDIALSGSISPYGYILLERSHDDLTIRDIPADCTYTGNLNNAGETLTLTNGSGAVIDVVQASDGWPAGNDSPRQSMERVDPLVGASADNWATHNGICRNGLDANGDPIDGTPRQPNSVTRSPTEAGDLLITAVHYDGYQGGDADEGFQLFNASTQTITLTSWLVSDNYGTFAFSPTLALDPGRSMWCARQAPSFALAFGFLPDFEYRAPHIVGGSLALGAEDRLVVRDTAGVVVDAVVWGRDVTLAGWDGPAVRPYANGTFATAGQILFRKRDEFTARPLADTDTAADWANDITPGSVLYGPVHEGDLYGKRVMYPGWDWAAYTRTFGITATAQLTVAVAPDHAYTVVAGLLRRAQQRILIEGYTFESVWLTGILSERLAAGVQVTMLLEGAPSGGLADQELWNCKQIVDAGGRVYFLHNDSSARIYDRYTNQHAKFVIVDGRWVAIGSENFGNHAMPVDDKSNGTAGDRGFVLITDQRDVVEYVTSLFAIDCDPLNHADIVAYGEVGRYVVPPTYTAVYSTGGGGYDYMAPFSVTMPAFEATSFEVIHAPETSLRYGDGLIGLLLQAGPGDEVYVEQMYERLHWGPPASDVHTDPNPRLEAYIQAARNGARVRILLDKGFDNERQNYETAFYLLDVAHAEGLDLDVRLGNPTRRGIHSKVVLANLDGTKHVHGGSINGSEAASKVNRELAVQVRSDGAYDYIKGVFEYDWAHSSGPYEMHLPAILYGYVPAADHVLISEVMFNPPGVDDWGEWVELYNPTESAVDIGGWYLGDAVRKKDYERLYAFPAGTAIPAQGTLVIARRATAYQALGYAGKPVPDWECKDSSSVPDMVRTSWGDGKLALGNAGDEVLLLDAARRTVDVVVYGTGRYSGVLSWGDVSGVYSGDSLERWPANRDSNDCGRDFRVRYAPDPGNVVTW